MTMALRGAVAVPAQPARWRARLPLSQRYRTSYSRRTPLVWREHRCPMCRVRWVCLGSAHMHSCSAQSQACVSNWRAAQQTTLMLPLHCRAVVWVVLLMCQLAQHQPGYATN